jgi:hypothetical protein
VLFRLSFMGLGKLSRVRFLASHGAELVPYGLRRDPLAKICGERFADSCVIHPIGARASFRRALGATGYPRTRDSSMLAGGSPHRERV